MECKKVSALPSRAALCQSLATFLDAVCYPRSKQAEVMGEGQGSLFQILDSAVLR